MGCRNALEQRQIVQTVQRRKKKREGEEDEGGSWEEKKSIPCQLRFCGDMWRIAKLIFFNGGKKFFPTRAWFCQHSGLHRKVTFERTIGRLFLHVCCYERSLRKGVLGIVLIVIFIIPSFKCSLANSAL